MSEALGQRGVNITDFRKTYVTPVPVNMPQRQILVLEAERDHRYGQNPTQQSRAYKLSGVSPFETDLVAFLDAPTNQNIPDDLRAGLLEIAQRHPPLKPTFPDINVTEVKTGKGGPSYTNEMDISGLVYVLKFMPLPAVMYNKHVNPTAVGVQIDPRTTMPELIDNAWYGGDPQAAFGCVAGLNVEVDAKMAERLLDGKFVEAVLAPSYTQEAMEILGQKERLRVFTYDQQAFAKLPKFVEDSDSIEGHYEFRTMPGTGLIVAETPFLSRIHGPEDVLWEAEADSKKKTYVVERDPTPEEAMDAILAWHVNSGTKSNSITFAKDGLCYVAMAGQQARVSAVEVGVRKGYRTELDRQNLFDNWALPKKQQRRNIPWTPDTMSNQEMIDLIRSNPHQGAAMASCGFFPFRDSVDRANEAGITVVIQPGGSEKDWSSIKAANEHGMAMGMTFERLFIH